MKTTYFSSLAIMLAAVSISLSCKKSQVENTDIAPLTTASAQLQAAAACSAQGWASQNGGTTGGGTATPTVVTTYATLKAAIQNTSVKVIQVNGTITIPSGGRISFQDQTGKTIFGSS